MSNRIKSLEDLIKKNSVVADIGCDHAYLIVELLLDKKIKYGYAIDNKDGPINNARKNITKFNLEDKCEIIKADGLSFNLNKKIDTLVFAGLGADNVINIIKVDKTKLKNIKYIVTDIHRNEPKLINYLKTLNYVIDKELSILDKKKKYHLVRYKYERK